MSLINTLPANLENKFVFIKTEGDGNCLFHAIANGIKLYNPQSQIDHKNIREMICEYYSNPANIDVLGIAAISMYGINTPETQANYIKYICTPNTWGTDIEISIFTRITEYHIEAYDNQGRRVTGESPANKSIIYLWNHKYRTDSNVPNHYTLLKPKVVSAAAKPAAPASAAKPVAPAPAAKPAAPAPAAKPAAPAPAAKPAAAAPNKNASIANLSLLNLSEEQIRQQVVELERIRRVKGAREQAETDALLARYLKEDEQVRRDAQISSDEALAKSLQNKRGGSLANLAKLSF